MTWRNLLRVVLAALVPRTATEESELDGDPSFDELDVVNSPTTKTESLERTLDRAESVLENQLALLSDTDDKAVQTVRIEMVLVGVIVSIAQITAKPIPVNIWMRLGGVLVIGSIIAGVFTYSSSSPDFGPDPNYVYSNFESGDTNEDVYLELLQGYDEAISYNSDVVNDSAKHLFVTQGLLIAGIIVGVSGVIFAF